MYTLNASEILSQVIETADLGCSWKVNHEAVQAILVNLYSKDV